MATDGQQQKKRIRSPAYPAFDLKSCIDKAQTIYNVEDKHFAPLEAIAAHWAYKANNSAFMQYLSALKQFGLLDEEGSNENRKFRLTDRALDILAYGEKDEKRLRAIKEAALAPKIHSELWAKYGGKLPHEDVSIRVYLIRERTEGAFNKDYVDDFIAQFRETLAFSGLTGTDTIPVDEVQKTHLNDSPKVGDAVQWTSAGVDQFPEPRRVLGISDDQEWAFVEGTQTGVPMAELTVKEPSMKTPPANPLFQQSPPSGKPGASQEVLTLDEGQVTLQWPSDLSKDSAEEFEYWVRGVLRRARRRAGLPPAKHTEPPEPARPA